MKTTEMVVVGSGPAGIACAQALLEKGHHVTLLDVGLTLDSQTETKIASLRQASPDQWPAGATDFMYDKAGATVRGVPLKKAYGSDFPYQGTDQDIPFERTNAALLPSFALGGLSTVWGAAVLPLRKEDLKHWPITLAELEPHYHAVLKEMPLAATHDSLEEEFPLYTDHPVPLRFSSQANAFLNDLEHSRTLLSREKIRFGAARLAVHAKGCVYCAQCLVGCPYGVIYSSDHILQKYRERPDFTYKPGWVVKRVEETAEGVTISGIDYASRTSQTFQGAKVFLAAGILPTTKILLTSLDAYDRPVQMATSQHFMFPWLRHKSVSGADAEPLHTLAQLFMEIEGSGDPEQRSHLQFYTYNELMKQALRRLGVGYLLDASRWARDAVYGRLLVTQGYLHSADSGSISISLQKSTTGESRLSLTGHASIKSRTIIHSLLKKLSDLSKTFGATPLPSMLSISPLGGGYHVGGTFPMKEKPQSFETDRMGRVHGFKKVHAVDATVFPDIASTTITLNVMANAHRIGSSHE